MHTHGRTEAQALSDAVQDRIAEIADGGDGFDKDLVASADAYFQECWVQGSFDAETSVDEATVQYLKDCIIDLPHRQDDANVLDDAFCVIHVIENGDA